MKVAHFTGDDRNFENKEKYSEWMFLYQPRQLPAAALPKQP
jgi:hypothetical protein